MASSSIFQRRFQLIPKSLIIHNYSLVVKSLYSSSSTCPLDFPEKPSSSTTPCFERCRMQSILDTSWTSSLQRPSQVSPWLMLPPELTFDEDEDEDEDEGEGEGEGEGKDEDDDGEDEDEDDEDDDDEDDDDGEDDDEDEDEDDDDDEDEDDRDWDNDEDRDKDNYNAAVVKNVVYKFYSIRDNKVIRFECDGGGEHLQLHNHRAGGSDEFKGSSHGWLALFDSSPPNDLFLYNPISRRRLKLPTMDTLPLRGRPRKKGPIDLLSSSPERSIVKKVILSSSDPEKDESCVAMMLYGAGNRLACCYPAPGARAKWYPLGSRHWVWSEDCRERSAVSYEDVVYSEREKLFFCLTKDELEAWDPMHLVSSDMPISIKDYFSSPNNKSYPWPRRCEREFYLKSLCNKYRERYLVVAEPPACGGGLPPQQLFLVQRHKMRLSSDGAYHDDDDIEFCNDSHPLQTVAFDVHRFDVEKRELVYMDRTLDGLAFFVGKNHSFAVRAGELDGGRTLKPDSIYFTDAEPQDDLKLFRSLNYKYGGHDNGVYDYTDGTFSSCYYPCEAASYRRMVPAPMWFSPLHYKPT